MTAARHRIEVHQAGRLVGTLPRPADPPLRGVLRLRLAGDPDPHTTGPRTTELRVEWRASGHWHLYAVLVADERLTAADLRRLPGFLPRWPRAFGL